MSRWTLPSVLILAVLAAAGCGDTSTRIGVGVLSAPTVPINATISPQALQLTTLAGVPCASFAASAARLQVAVFAPSGTNLFVDRVTFRLLDGSSVGGPQMTFPRADLNALFGTTLVNAGAQRVFAFQPTFGCGVFQPITLAADLFLLDQFGVQRVTTLTAVIRK